MYVNQIKYQRAVAECGKGASEEKIKERYLKLGGVFVDDAVVAELPVSPVKVEKKKENIVKKVVKKITKKK